MIRFAKNLGLPVVERMAKNEFTVFRKPKNNFLLRKEKQKKDTSWYDTLCELQQRTKKLGLHDASTQLRNVLWEQVRGLVHGRVHEFIREKKSNIRKDRELCQKLFQESFFIFCKGVDIWDSRRRTKFLTFLGDILNQEILNRIRLHNYHKQRVWKLENKLKNDEAFNTYIEPKENDVERQNFFDEIKTLFESYSFSDSIERDIAYTIVYGKIGDWSRLQKKSGLGLVLFYKKRTELIEKLRTYILSNSTPKMKSLMEEILEEGN